LTSLRRHADTVHAATGATQSKLTHSGSSNGDDGNGSAAHTNSLL
jgi:hypothetical protein